MPLEAMVKEEVRSSGERCPDGLTIRALDYLVNQGLLIHYHGGYTFPDTKIPSKNEIEQSTIEHLRKMM